MRDAELAPCPFCAGKASISTIEGVFFVSCEKCAAGSGGTINYANAIAAWNRRTAAARIVELEQQSSVKDTAFLKLVHSSTEREVRLLDRKIAVDTELDLARQTIQALEQELAEARSREYEAAMVRVFGRREDD